jgi:hypothetical protein
LADLEKVLAHLTEELSGWRRRCQRAEAELQAVKGQAGMVPGDELVRQRSRLLDLERENLELTARVERAREMVLHAQHRLAFLDGEGQPPESA